MLCVDITPHYHKMCDSPILKFSVRNDSLLRCVHSVEGDCDEDIHLDYVGFQVRDSNENSTSCGPCSKSNITFPYKVQLEQEVQTLQQKLREEMELHTVLENAVGHTAGQLASLSYLPHNAQELLSSIAILEVTVSKLEKEMVSLHFQLSQERNERRLAEYHLKHSPSQLAFLSSPANSKKPDSSSFGCSIHSLSEPCDSLEEISCQERRDLPLEASTRSSSTCSKIENMVDCGMFSPEKQLGTDIFQHVAVRKLTKEMPLKGLWNHPNKLSEEMVHCMKNIFISLSDSSSVSSKLFAWENGCSPSSPHGHLSSSSLWSLSDRSMLSSSGQSPQVDLQCNGEVLATENACDPYRVHGKLSWADIGCYGLAVEVSWMSVGKEELEYAASALRRFRLLVEQLAKVNPIHLNCNEKLAFWINLYNALIMHAYLAYGVPRSDLKLFSLMQKAAYTVGGHSFSAAAIEYVILKMKPPVHRPQTALLLAIHKLKVSEEQQKVAIDSFEPLVMFSLSCGMYSSPAVRIYTAKNVREELQEAQRDYIRASVGVSSKGRILVPKMLHCFAKGFVDDANLAVWISRYLPPHQAAFVEQCISQRRQRFLGSRNCGILPFDCRFRYLFLPDEITQ